MSVDYPVGVTCAEFVELVTDYLEGTLAEAPRRLFELHLRACPGCETYVDQFREVIRVAGRLRPEDVDPRARELLLAQFASWKLDAGGAAG